jgi:hypothetical protein
MHCRGPNEGSNPGALVRVGSPLAPSGGGAKVRPSANSIADGLWLKLILLEHRG